MTPQAIAIKVKFMSSCPRLAANRKPGARVRVPGESRPFMRRGRWLQLSGNWRELADQEGRGGARQQAAKSDQPLAERNCCDVHGPISPATLPVVRRWSAG